MRVPGSEFGWLSVLVLFSNFPCSSPYHKGLTTVGCISQDPSSIIIWLGLTNGRNWWEGRKNGEECIFSLCLLCFWYYLCYVYSVNPTVHILPILLFDSSFWLRSHRLLPLFLHSSCSPILPYIARGLPPVGCFPVSRISWLLVSPNERHLRQIEGQEWRKGEGNFPFLWFGQCLSSG